VVLLLSSRISAGPPNPVDTDGVLGHPGGAMSVSADRLFDEVAALPDSPRPMAGGRPMGQASANALRKGVNYSHQAMIDLILSCPGISQNDLAAHFGYSPSWISTIMASDAFQAQLAKRREEIIDPILTATVEEKFKGILARSADILMEKLNGPANTIPDNLALRSMELSSRALGYGARQEPPPAAPQEIHLHLETLGGNLTNLLRRKKVEALEHDDAEIIPQVSS